MRPAGFGISVAFAARVRMAPRTWRKESQPRAIAERYTAGFGLGGGSSRATTVSVKPEVLCEPSQKGLFAEWPQRQSDTAVCPPSPKALPSGSRISKSPSTRMDPLFLTVIFVAAIFSPREQSMHSRTGQEQAEQKRARVLRTPFATGKSQR